MEDREFRQQVARVEALLEAVEALGDPQARRTALEAVEGIVLLYGEGLSRMVAAAADAGDRRLLEGFASDEAVSHLLLVHGLHPLDLETRVTGALDEVRPYLRSHGGDVDLVQVEGAGVRLRLRGTCQGCPSSILTLKMTVEEALRRMAPDLETIEIEGLGGSPSDLVPLESLSARDGESPGGAWTVVGGLPQLAGGGILPKEVSGRALLFLRLDDSYYAYQNGCAACGKPLGEAELRGSELTCPHCRSRFDVRRAGRCLDTPSLHLEPLPLLVGGAGVLKVALPQEAV